MADNCSTGHLTPVDYFLKIHNQCVNANLFTRFAPSHFKSIRPSAPWWGFQCSCNIARIEVAHFFTLSIFFLPSQIDNNRYEYELSIRIEKYARFMFPFPIIFSWFNTVFSRKPIPTPCHFPKYYCMWWHFPKVRPGCQCAVCRDTAFGADLDCLAMGDCRIARRVRDIV